MADLAYEGKGELKPGPWCTFCRASGKCRARTEANPEMARLVFAKPPLLTDEEVTGLLGRLDDLIRWAEDLKNYALDQALRGKQWPGWKLVAGRTVRRYTDEAAAAAAGCKDIYHSSLRSVAKREKLMGKKTFAEILGKFVYKLSQN